jgi:hypothetical protein
MPVLDRDIETLQKLGNEVGQIARQSRFPLLRKEWISHNDMKSMQRPRVLIYPDQDGVWKEIISDRDLQCQDSFLRQIEFQLRQKIFRAAYFRDDFIIEPEILLEIPGEYTGYHYGKGDQHSAWGLPLKGKWIDPQGGSYTFDPVLREDHDFHVLLNHKLDFFEDTNEWAHRRELLETIFYGILGIKWELPYVVLVCSLLIELIHLRGLETLYLDLYDQPERLHEVLCHMGKEKEALLLRLQDEGRLVMNNRDHWTGAGAVGYSETLEPERNRVQLSNLWGFADAQEFSDVSIPMWRDFALINQALPLKRFGYSCYGCCEPMDGRYETVFDLLPNLRRISVSPWANIHEAAEAIGKRAIYSWKPNPSEICNGFDEEQEKRKISNLLKATSNCYTEIVLKDLRTCNGNPEHLIRWINLASELCEAHA